MPKIISIIVPFIVIMGGFLTKRYEKYWYAFAPVLLLYISASFPVDSFLLDFINLPF